MCPHTEDKDFLLKHSHHNLYFKLHAAYIVIKGCRLSNDERTRFYLSPMYCSVRVTAQGGVKLTSFQSERKICLYNCQPMFPLVFRKRCLLRSAEKSLKDTMEPSSHSTFAALLLIVYTKCGEVEVCVG